MYYKRGIYNLVFTFLVLFDYGNSKDFFDNDFRDKYSNYVVLDASLDAKSNNLPLNIFDKKWYNLPQHKKDNYAFINFESKFYSKINSFNIGAFYQRFYQIYINDGFIKTWYEADKNFFKLLLNKDINNSLPNTPIKGDANHFISKGIFIQNILEIDSNHYFSSKIKLHSTSELQYIKVRGNTNQERFTAGFDYYYSKKNLISKRDNNQSAKGKGYSIDLEYLYEENNLYGYFGVFNIYSHIYWSGISLMHYDFDSQVIYRGDDGYNHYKPFGVGYYKENQKFKQTLPMYYKAAIKYKINELLSVGNNIDLYDKVFYNEFYTILNFEHGKYKIGYIDKTNDFILGASFRYFALELTKNPQTSNNMIKGNLRFSF